MKMTPVGLIPEDWDVATIKDFGHLLSDGINPQQYREKVFVEYSMPAYDDGQCPTKCKGADMNSNRTLIKGEVLLFNKLNVRQKRVWHVENAPSNALCSMEFLAYSSDKVDLRLLREILLQDSVTKGFESVSRGTSNSQKRIAPSDFLNFSFALPPLAEQHRIADALSCVDDMIRALDEVIAKKRQIKEGLMQQLMTGIQRVDGRRSELVLTEMGLVPKDWRLAKLKDFIEDINDGPFGSNLKREHYTLDREVRIVQLGNVGEDGWNDDNIKYTTFEHAKTLKRCIIPYGSVIITKMMPAGRAILCPNKDPMYIQGSDVIKVKFTSEIDNNFFVYYTKTRFYQEQIDSSLQGSTRARTNISKIKSIMIPLPAIEEQKRIVGILSCADAEILSLESHQAKYRLIKRGMMQELLTGKTRL